ncbi:hypothetical protein AVEN_5740-1 [Araneus ventricosus]|uniref:Uncharacterized protein n=1 Tax=Araneus ventricosus TaxID=182803 RepID=A0A4Y2DW92_ARAVE|nr:hypothetical protein AVEN_5740-1 [Araneus ventricosus]
MPISFAFSPDNLFSCLLKPAFRMAEHAENEDIIMGQKLPEKLGDQDFTPKPDKFEVLEYQLGEAIKRMWVIQTRLDRLVFSHKKFMYEDELNMLVQEVDRCTKELKLLQLKDEKYTQKIKAVLITLLLILLFRFFLFY